MTEPNIPDDPTPGQLAGFDQAWAQVNTNLNVLVAGHRELLAEAVQPAEVDICGLNRWLLESVDADWLAEVLACAVHRLALAEVSR